MGRRARRDPKTVAAAGTEEDRTSARLVEATSRLHALPPTALEPDALFTHILEVSLDLTGAEKGAYLRPTRPYDIAVVERFEEARSGSPLLGAVADRVAGRQETVILNDPAALAALAADPLAASLRNLAGFPIVAGGTLRGVVVVADRRAGPFTDDHARLLLGIGSHAAVAIENRRLRRELEAAYAGTVALLCDVIEAKDHYTHGHCQEVAALALAAARQLGLDPLEQRAAFQAGLLHDVGKVAVGDAVLGKPGPLLPVERAAIERHPAVGADLVRLVPALVELAPIVRHHHERYDGGGYPDKLAGEAIPLLARVLGVADAYEAMRSTRPYRSALAPAAAREELRRGAGTQFDPRVVEALLRALDEPEAARRAERATLGGAEAWPAE